MALVRSASQHEQHVPQVQLLEMLDLLFLQHVFDFSTHANAGIGLIVHGNNQKTVCLQSAQNIE
jgi:hypothetical protein